MNKLLKMSATCVIENRHKLKGKIPSIYIIKGDKFYKIGFANNVKSRLSTIQAGNPFDLELVFSKELFSAPLFEQRLHKMFYSKRVRGEWFVLDTIDIAEITTLLNEWAKEEEAILLETAEQK